jgi:hypothetical protein
MRWHDVPRGTMDEARSHVRLDLASVDGKADPKIVPPRSRTPCWKGPGWILGGLIGALMIVGALYWAN